MTKFAFAPAVIAVIQTQKSAGAPACGSLALPRALALAAFLLSACGGATLGETCEGDASCSAGQVCSSFGTVDGNYCTEACPPADCKFVFGAEGACRKTGGTGGYACSKN